MSFLNKLTKMVIPKEKLNKVSPESAEQGEPQQPDVRRGISRRAIFIGIGGAVSSVGIIMFFVYIFTTNMAIGLPGVIMGFAGGALFYIYWKKEDEIITTSMGKRDKAQYNSLVIYPDIVLFKDVENPKGRPWRCENDGKPYFVHIWLGKKLKPFTLPDQKYYDPRVFAERVLSLPAHQKLFARKEDIFQKLRPLFVILAILVVWLLIITTTG